MVIAAQHVEAFHQWDTSVIRTQAIYHGFSLLSELTHENLSKL
jgi:hypothetical protein